MVKRHLEFCFGPNLGLRLEAGTKLNNIVVVFVVGYVFVVVVAVVVVMLLMLL